VPERTLHLLALLGGWPGAILGQRHFRHKTRKVSFLFAFWAVVVCISPSSGPWLMSSSAHPGVKPYRVTGR
jgi:uncharacterized membrane protein YsdA (DUF1294 family)